MAQSLKVYFADLTHDTIGLATEVFPLNVGFVAAYCKKRFGDEVEVRIFKYIPSLEEALLESPPDVLALSNYSWCHNIDMAMLRLLAERRPEALRILGGPNFPHEADAQSAFLRERPLVDAYVYLDGEVGFANVLEVVRSAGGLEEGRKVLKSHAVAGVVQVDADGRLLAPPLPQRLRELDEIPSPYLTGLFDEFFDGRLHPMIQTNRGCPFRCTFCADGTELVSKINSFSIERVRAEIEYIGRRVPKNVRALFISDLNFGMYKRDLETCSELARVKAAYGYPDYIEATTGKNSKHRIINAIEKLGGTLSLTMSVQSMTPAVLKNIKRDNIRVEDFLALKPAVKRARLPTYSEVILGLPGETRESHMQTLGRLLNSEIDHVASYTLILLEGAELASERQRAQWEFKTKFRVIPRDFTRLSNGEKVVEVEEVVVGSKSMSWDDYLYCRKIAFLAAIIHNPGHRALLHFLVQQDLSIIDLLRRMLDALDRAPREGMGQTAPERVAAAVRAFENDTARELWDDARTLQEFFRDEAHFQGLVEGRYGANVLATQRARAFADGIAEFSACAFAHARAMVSERGERSDGLAQLGEIEKYTRGRIYNLLGKDRLQTVVETELSYDFDSWLNDPEARSIEDFHWPEPKKLRFALSSDQYRLLEDVLDHFGHDEVGKGKALSRININALWRNAVAENAFESFFVGELPHPMALITIAGSTCSPS